MAARAATAPAPPGTRCVIPCSLNKSGVKFHENVFQRLRQQRGAGAASRKTVLVDDPGDRPLTAPPPARGRDIGNHFHTTVVSAHGTKRVDLRISVSQQQSPATGRNRQTPPPARSSPLNPHNSFINRLPADRREYLARQNSRRATNTHQLHRRPRTT